MNINDLRLQLSGSFDLSIEQFQAKSPHYYVYFLFLQGHLIYIGTTRQLALRMHTHNISFDESWYLLTDDPTLEAQLIAHFQPYGNINVNGRRRRSHYRTSRRSRQ